MMKVGVRGWREILKISSVDNRNTVIDRLH